MFLELTLGKMVCEGMKDYSRMGKKKMKMKRAIMKRE